MSLEKPVIFFSHSSRDKVALKKLKEKFDELTGGTIDVFLSSDGQSIRLGSNWVSSIEDALKAAKIMFVFVSPHSLNTPWLYFETGHAYSKGISVVPVGLFGVDIGKLSPPINLLQGFNLADTESMNNIIAKVNEVFGTRHKLAFNIGDYRDVHANASDFGQRILGSHAAMVDHVSLHLKVDETMIAKVKAALLTIPNCLERFAKTNGSTVLDLPGASVNLSQLSKRSEQNPLKSEPTTVSSIQVNFDPVAIDAALPTVEGAILEAIANEPGCDFTGFWCTIAFGGLVNNVHAAHQQLGRLGDFKLAPLFAGNPNVQFERDDMKFQVDRPLTRNSNSHSRIVLVRPDLRPYAKSQLPELVDLLFERGVLFYVD